MDDIGTEDTKPFEIDTVKEEEDAQPDPDEHLEMSNGGGRVWSVKVNGLSFSFVNSPVS